MSKSADIQAHCCGADLLFDEKTANKQYKDYLKNGPSRVTRHIIAQLQETPIGESLLDIGGGIGALQWWFLESGGKQTIGVDASSGYLNLAKSHSEKKGWDGQAQFLFGDFTDHEKSISKVDHITLDKVICCYPDYKAILDLACEKSAKTISLSYPMDGKIANLFRWFGVQFMRFKGIPFKPYVHSVNDVRQLMESHGFMRKQHQLRFPWHVELYQKV